MGHGNVGLSWHGALVTWAVIMWGLAGMELWRKAVVT